MERGLIMLIHSIVISILFYILLAFVLKQKPAVAENRSILVGCMITIYMILFGHGLPKSINNNLF
jgi:hypothetical protein